MDEVNINVAVGSGSNAGDGKQKKSIYHHFYRSPEERLTIGKDMYTKFMNGETIHELSEEYGYSSCASTNSAVTNIMREYVSDLSFDEQYLFEKRRSHYGRTHREEIAKEFRIMHPEAADEDCKKEVSEETELEACATEETFDEFDDCIAIKDAISDIDSAGGFLYTVVYGGNDSYISRSYEEANSLFESALNGLIKGKISGSLLVVKIKVTNDKIYRKVIQEVTLNYK